MSHKWTLEERKKHLREHYPEKRKKLTIFLGLIVVVILLAAGLGYSITYVNDPALILILAIILVLTICASIFLVDVYFLEIW